MNSLVKIIKTGRLNACNNFSLKCYSVSHANQTTVDEREVSKFTTNLAENFWWNKNSSDALHKMNRLRIPFIRDGILQTRPVDKIKLSSSHPLENFKILDVGCGGGILAEPLSRLGAKVTGLDPVEDNITFAKRHAKNSEDTRKIEYLCTTVEHHAETHADHYDAVIASEVAEHVADLKLFISSCVSLTKETGSVFITTINKNFLSWLLAIKVAENVLNILPPGTHDWEKFIPPQDLEHLLQSNNCHVRTIHGMLFLPLWNKWMWISDTRVNYAVHAVKRSDITE